MGSSSSKPKKEQYVIHIKKCTIRDNNIYLFDGDKVAKIILENKIKYIPKDNTEHISSEISL
jgi:hypothetical protein